MNITTPDKVEKLWHDWCVECINRMSHKNLVEFALEQMKQQYISHVYKHRGHVPDYDAILEDMFNYYEGDKEEVEAHLNGYDITLESFDGH